MSTASTRRHQVWIGLAEVRQRPGAGVLLDRNEAAVNVLALASGRRVFEAAVVRALGSLGFDLVDLEDSEPLAKRRQRFVVSDELLRLADEVAASGEVRFGAFHTWVSDG